MASTLPLNDTKVQMNWKEFQELSTQKVDTVVVTPKSKPPVSMIFDNCEITISLSDSIATGEMTLSYVVLSESDWIEKVIFPSTAITFSEIRIDNGDAVVPTDSGYVLLAKGTAGTSRRSLTIKWSGVSTSKRGVRSFPFATPKVSTGAVLCKVPHSYSNISLQNSALLSSKKTNSSTHYSFSFPRQTRTVLEFTPPVTTIQTVDTAVDTTPIVRETQITTSQEIIHYISDERILAISDLKLTVNHSPITKFSIALPEKSEILAVEANGIKRWNIRNRDTIDVELTFELQGDYHIAIISEFKPNAIYTIQPLSVSNADREKGKIAIALEGAGEAHFTSLSEGLPLPRNRFLSTLGTSLRKSNRKYKKSLDQVLIAAEFASTDFKAQVETRRHEPAKVANAVVDSGVIYTALTKEYKSITTVQYYLRQRNRQFIELSLPPNCELWSVSINETEVTPFMDDEGGVKIPLQRFSSSDKKSMELAFTYYEKVSHEEMQITLATPLPNVPVNQINWSLYYPEEWQLDKALGDFSVFQKFGIKKIQHSLSTKQQQIQYDRLLSESMSHTMDGGKKNLPLTGLSLNHLVGKRILVVDEEPLFVVRFIETQTILIRKMLFVLITLISSIFIIRRLLKSNKK
jgi:hypothetical protein